MDFYYQTSINLLRTYNCLTVTLSYNLRISSSRRTQVMPTRWCHFSCHPTAVSMTSTCHSTSVNYPWLVTGSVARDPPHGICVTCASSQTTSSRTVRK